MSAIVRARESRRHHAGRTRARRRRPVPARRTGRRRPARRVSASKSTSTSSAPRSGTASTARCSIRSIRSCARCARVAERIEHASDATRRGHVVYVSNHKSHLDYLVEPLVLDDHGIRPPLMAAGINLFGGALGLLHRHVTGAIPIRRNSKDPVYLVTLSAYVAELLKRRDLLYYAEGGRSYSGELKSPKTGLLQAALQADRHDALRRADGGRLRPRARRSHHLARGRTQAHAAVRPGSRRDGAARGRLPVARVRDVRRADSARRLRPGVAPRPGRRWRIASRTTIGRLYKVLPTALVAVGHAAADDSRASWSRGSTSCSARSAAEGAQPRGADRPAGRRRRRRAADRARRARRRNASACASAIGSALRYYARTIEHLVTPTTRDDALMLDALPKAVLRDPGGQPDAQTLASRYGMRRPDSFARRFIAGETVGEAIDAAQAHRAARSRGDARPARRKRQRRRRPRPTRRGRTSRRFSEIERGGIGRNISLKLTQLGLDVDRATSVDNLRRMLDAAAQAGFFVRIDMENSPVHRPRRSTTFETRVGDRAIATSASCIQSYLRRSTDDVGRMNALGVRVRLVKGAYREPRERRVPAKVRGRRRVSSR